MLGEEALVDVNQVIQGCSSGREVIDRGRQPCPFTGHGRSSSLRLAGAGSGHARNHLGDGAAGHAWDDHDAFFGSENYKMRVNPDEATFIDPASVATMVTDEKVVI